VVIVSERALAGAPMGSGAPDARSDSDRPVVWLHEARAADATLTGAKAANLARAAAASLPVVPGFAITTSVTEDGVVASEAMAAVRAAWAELSADGAQPLAVRSSSTAEDTRTSSMAGQFTSVLEVRGWEAFLDAVATVLASASHPHAGTSAPRPMAVLVQRHVHAECGGVLFGLDPVSGDRRHVIVEAVCGSPDALVSGRVTAAHAVLGRHGRVVGGGPQLAGVVGRRHRRRLARLARESASAFDGPQDVEWAVDRDHHLWLLQSRDVTAAGLGALATGPILGPGPVAETFPDPLQPLEVDLWVESLRNGVAGALHVTGAQPRHRIEGSPVVCAVGGRAAADLELFGIVPAGGSFWRLVNPLRGARRAACAWRVGRLRAALPALVGDLLAQVDAELSAVGPLPAIDDRELVDLLERGAAELVALHGHEVLAGMLLGEQDQPSLMSVALDALDRGRAGGLSDDAAIERDPVVLALTPPAIAPRPPLPAGSAPHPDERPLLIGDLGCRDALRLRCRWVQELTARAAAELGNRLAARGHLADAGDVRGLHLDELESALDGLLPSELGARLGTAPGAPLPMAFRLAPPMTPVATTTSQRGATAGLAASSGRAVGTVRHDVDGAAPGVPCILVVDTLDPRLAAVLPRLAGLISETGSALSHLAILARELGLPAVVAVPDARRRFPEGCEVVVDGDLGEVQVLTGGRR
jgi:pyruvate,water dikinase